MKDLSVVIVNYKAMEHLPACLAAVDENLAGIDGEVLFVDNGSEDGAPEWVRARYPEAIVRENLVNLGFARAVNQAVERSAGAAILLLNPDTVPGKGAFEALLDFLTVHPQAGLVGPRIEYPDGTVAHQCRREIPEVGDAFVHLFGLRRMRSRLTGERGYTLDHLDPGEEHMVGALSGSCMMIRREVFSDIGLLDEEFFLYGEDLDFCMRARRSGWEIHYTPRARVVHAHGASSRQRRLPSTIDFYRAMRIFYRKHYAPYRHPLVNGAVSAGIGLRMLYSLATIPLRPNRRAG